MVLGSKEICEIHDGVYRTTGHPGLIIQMKQMRDRLIWLIETNEEVYELHVIPGASNDGEKSVDYVLHLSEWCGGINYDYDSRKRMWENYRGSKNVVPFPEKHDAFKEMITEVMLNDWGYERSSINVIDTRVGVKK